MLGAVKGFEPYPNYKSSNVEWIPTLPAGWTIKRLKQIVDTARQITYGIVQAGPNLEKGIPYIRPADMEDEKGVKDFDNLMKTSPAIASDYERSAIKEGDIVCSIGPSFGKLMIVPKELEGGNLTQGTARVAIDSENNTRFVFWLLRSSESFQQWESSVGGATFRALNLGPLSETFLPVPPLPEQTQIAAFLDHETARIDDLIAKQQRLIALLEEKRQAVISHAVTKGLNPDAPMRPSGIDWLGDVPAHWETRKISKLTNKITNGYVGPTRDILVDEGLPYIQATHVKKGKVNFDNAYFVRRKWSDAHAKSILAEGDVLVVQTGAGTGDVACVSKAEEGYNCHALIILSAIKEVIQGQFLSLALRSTFGQAVLYSIRTGGMHPHLNCSEVKFVDLPVPPLNEQSEIVDYVRNQTDKFDDLDQKAQSAILLLQERRTALISAAVTGKIDVRDWRSPTDTTHGEAA
ncbi:restriction endonuclease subunit S [Shimia sediminis]|uniref:restriction endonuclease subunit S n=1 Tax=Shimia sediminis TaxID=2497945 RepID=UPI000F8EBBE4|nr:restriction endonuclease subunit S [Shimia sediminis]